MQNVTALIVWNTRNTFKLKSTKKGQIFVLTFKTSHCPHGVPPQSKPIFVLPPHSHGRSSSLGNDYNERLVIVAPPHMLRGRLTPSCPLLLLSQAFLMKTNVWYIRNTFALYSIFLVDGCVSHCDIKVFLSFVLWLKLYWLYLASLFFLRSLLLLLTFRWCCSAGD